MFVARPEEQYVTEPNNMPSDVTIVPMGLDSPATVAPEEEVNTAVVNVDSDASTVTTQTDKVNNDDVGAATDINATTIAELECPYANCKYVTGAGQDCVQYGMEMYAAAYMQRDLKMHIAGKHTEYVDAARTTDSKGRNKSSDRSYGSKKRNKSRKSDLEYDGGAELC